MVASMNIYRDLIIDLSNIYGAMVCIWLHYLIGCCVEF